MITCYKDFELQFNPDLDLNGIPPDKLNELTFKVGVLFHDTLMNTIDLKERVRIMTAIASFMLAVSTVNCMCEHCEPNEEEFRKDYN